MRDAKDDGRKAMKILREHYAGKGQPRIVSLYTEFSSLQKTSAESATDYLLKGERLANSLLTAGETLSDSLIVAMLLKGLPAEYNAFVAVVTQNEDNYRDFSKFKVSLKNFEDTLRNTRGRDDSIMRSSEGGNRHGGGGGGTCYACNGSGHKAPNCKLKKDVNGGCIYGGGKRRHFF